MNLLSTNMEEIADIFIRPARHLYKLSDLGPKNLTLDGQLINRVDFETKNKKGLVIRGSYFLK